MMMPAWPGDAERRELYAPRRLLAGVRRSQWPWVVVATFLITAIPIRAGGAASPATAYWRYLITPLTSANSLQEVLLAAPPLLLTGLPLSPSPSAPATTTSGPRGSSWRERWVRPFRACTPRTSMRGSACRSPSAPAPPPGCCGPAWLKRAAGIDEVVMTLLLNPVALLLLQGLLNGPWRHPESGFPIWRRSGYEPADDLRQ